VTGLQLATAAVLLVTLLGQALAPSRRLLVVTGGAAIALLVMTLGGGVPAPRLFAAVPWDVLVIVVSLGLLSQRLAASRAFGLLAVAAARLSRGNPLALLLLFAAGMYAVSGLVNNLTALLLVLPVLLNLLQLRGVSQRYVTWTLGAVLVACNLGGAATPIGDFPAILLLGRGAMGFEAYLARALPQTLVALALFGVLVILARPAADVRHGRLSARLALRTIGELYRGVRLDRRALVPSLLALAAMLIAWSTVPRASGIGPELIAWLGAGVALVAAGRAGEDLLRRRVDVEAVLFLLALFLMVGAVRESGTFAVAGQALVALPVAPAAQVAIFLVAAALLTGLFSAGPGMAALLEVASTLAERHPPAAIYVGLAMSVCAGSSLFLTAATSGPLAQALTERARLRAPDGAPIRFGFFQFAPVGLVGFAVILGTGLTIALASL
jgi:Na+/H+ antiporter NhaD/arsenite permease-like protein